MSAPIWLTNSGDLGIIPEQEYFEFFFDAYNPAGGSLTYSLIAGQLPTGLEIKSNGSMLGIPSGKLGGVPSAVEKVTVSEFTIRITNSNYLVADRTFSITVAGILPQTIIPASADLGTFVDGTFIELDINTIEPNPYLDSTFSIIEGELPLGLSLDPITGIISGYAIPVVTGQSAGNSNFDMSPWDEYAFDFTGISSSKNYQFTIKADNGITIETKIYTIYIIAISNLTADNDILKADNVSKITADFAPPYHSPVILNNAGSLGQVRQNTEVNIQINGKDFDNDIISYSLSSGSLPPGLSLNPVSGWITGIVPFGQLGSTTYTFSIRVFKTDIPEYISSAKTFTLDVLGQVDDIVTWITDSDLGILYGGEISELYIEATTPSGRLLNYNIVAGSYGRLPPGLTLTTSGLLSGRVSFESFMLDSGTTTFDNNTTLTTFDRVFTFTISAADIENYVYSTKTFTLKIDVNDVKPFENLYISILPNKEQRAIYNSIVNNGDIFPDSYLYRSTDPWFGKNLQRRSLFLAGLNPDTAAEYISAMTLNHYWKTLYFGEIKTAQALDNNFNSIYEVVYIELLVRGVNEQGLSPNLSISLPANSRNISTVYPNSFPNMALRIENNVGYENRSILPKWMTSRQIDGTVLGFTRALVLCYARPGKAEEIAYRVRQIQSEFQYIDFTIDRYEWDNSLSDSFNKTTGSFIPNNFAYASGNITANTVSNTIIGLTTTVNGSGTISGTVGTTSVIGTNTSFGTEFRVGRPIYRADTNQEIGIIKSISSSTSCDVLNPLVSTISNISYFAETNTTEFSTEIFVGDTILVGNVRLGTVKSVNSDSNITLYANSLANVTNVQFLHNNKDPSNLPGDGDKYLKYPQVGVIT